MKKRTWTSQHNRSLASLFSSSQIHRPGKPCEKKTGCGRLRRHDGVAKRDVVDGEINSRIAFVVSIELKRGHRFCADEIEFFPAVERVDDVKLGGGPI